MTVDALLQSIPPLTVYVVVGMLFGRESWASRCRVRSSSSAPQSAVIAA